jgi:hypothetical protein
MTNAIINEYWIARVQYRPEQEPEIIVCLVFYAWQNGDIDFIPFNSYEGDPVRSTQCARFELLERIEMEKYK